MVEPGQSPQRQEPGQKNMKPPEPGSSVQGFAFGGDHGRCAYIADVFSQQLDARGRRWRRGPRRNGEGPRTGDGQASAWRHVDGDGLGADGAVAARWDV